MNQLWLLTTLLVVLLAMTVMSQDKAEVCNGKCKRLEKKCQKMTKFMSKNCIEKVDGEWGEWNEWGECSVQCGTGTQSRTRDYTEPKNNGAHPDDYPSGNTENRECAEEGCPDSGKYDVYDGDCSGGVIQKQSADLANDEKRVHTDGGCEKICLNDPICTGFSFTIPFNDAEECWTYSTRLAEGDGALNKRCYMKKYAENYVRSTGPCRGGYYPDDNAGRTKNSGRNCETLCSDDPKCFSFFIHFNHPDSCWTYTSPFAEGDITLHNNGTCFTKKLNYELSYGGCRGGMSPENYAGMTYQDNRDCQSSCDAEPSCTAFAWTTSESYEHQGCWKYTSKHAKGSASSEHIITCATKTYANK